MKLFIAFLCAATAFPAMPFERAWPYAPAPDKIAREPGTTSYHFYKNIWTESVRADCQWMGKFLAFVICVQALIIFYMAATGVQ